MSSILVFPRGASQIGSSGSPQAQRLLRESIAAHEDGGTPHNVGITLGGLGLAVRGSSQAARARQHLCRALRMGVGPGSCLPLMHGLPGIALLLANEGQHERAVEVYALASRYPGVANSQRYKGVVGRHIAAAKSLPQGVVAAAQERGRARDLHATVAELLAELGE
jgi:hypothetical protein